MSSHARLLGAMAALVCIGLALPRLATAQVAPAAENGQMPEIIGNWIGSRLQCRKDETGPVRCGTPTPFQVTFRKDGTGTSQGEGFPSPFSYRISGPGKVAISSPDGSRTFEIFQIRVESDFISFQMYFYPEAVKSAGEDYIHYIYDLAKQDETISQP